MTLIIKIDQDQNKNKHSNYLKSNNRKVEFLKIKKRISN